MADSSQYNYALLHQNPGVPLSGAQPVVYHLAGDRVQDNNNSQLTLNPKYNNDSLVTEGLLLKLTDCDTIDEIHVISLRNKELTSCLRILSQCINLNIAYLQGNRIHLQDMMYLQAFQNLKKLDLSHNNISSLPGPSVFKGLKSLKFLYLHNNKLAKWQDISSLTSIPNVLHITLFSNPVCTVPGYRHFLVNSIRSLLALDHYVITDEERIEDASFGYRFRALNEFMKLHIPDYAREKSAEQHLFNLEVDIYRLKRIFERNSPSIMIQAVYRGFRQRHRVQLQMDKKIKMVIKVQKVVRGWLERLKFRKDLMDMLAIGNMEYLMLSNKELRQRSAGSIIKKFMIKKYREKKREQLEQKSALLIQRIVRGRQVRQKSFFLNLELDKYPRIYFLKEQKPLFIKLIKELSQIVETKFNLRFEDLMSMINEDNTYETIRVAEPDIFDYKWQPFIQFILPTLQSRIRENKHQQYHCFQNERFSLFNMYFKPDYEDNQRSWSIIQIRNCKIYKQKVLKAIEQRNLKRAPKNQFIFQDQYRDFLVFEPKNLELLNMILHYVLHYNREANLIGDQLFLLFFDFLLKRICAASMIQRNYRAYLFRRRFYKPRKYPIQELLQNRAATCIQRWWSDLRFSRRVEGMVKIKKFIQRIKSPVLYIEQSIYNNLKKITQMIQTQMRYEEQILEFDFNTKINEVCLQINENHKYVTRYQQQSVPYWYELPFKSIDFSHTPYLNKLQALFHLNEIDCQLLPVSFILNYQNKQLDIDRDLCFIQFQCHTIEEAKRRAYIVAALTYDIHSRIFVSLATSDLLLDPFQIQNIFNIRQRFEIDPETTSIQNNFDSLPEKKVKDFISTQSSQPHSGIFLSSKDTRVSRYLQNRNLSFKKLPHNDKNFLISCNTLQDQSSFELELERRISGPKKTDLSHFESKKLHQEAFNLLKKRRTMALQEGVNDFKDLKESQKQEVKEQMNRELEIKREEVNKVREISKIIQTEQKSELDKNLQVFLQLNREEKNLRRELVEKQVEVELKEKYLKKISVQQQHRSVQEKKQEKMNFINQFMQAKNLIEKQMKIGRKIKDFKLLRQEKREKVVKMKEMRETDASKERITVKSVLFDTNIESAFSLEQQAKLNRQNMSQFKSGRNGNSSFQDGSNVEDTRRQILLNSTADDSQTKYNGKGIILKSASLNNNSRNQVANGLNRSYVLPLINNQNSTFINPRNVPTAGGTFIKNEPPINSTIISYHSQIPQQSSQRGLEEIFSYVHDDSRMNWKRDSTKPIFAEENYPMTRNYPKKLYKTGNNQLSINYQPFNPGASIISDGMKSQPPVFSVQRSINAEQNTISSNDQQNKQSSERRSLIQKISY